MKKRILIISLGIISLTISIMFFVYFNFSSQNNFKKLIYDILIEEHRYEYEGVDLKYIPETGYSTKYYYIAVNSDKLEKYTIRYSDILEIHNKKGDLDQIYIKIEKIDQNELENILKIYKKNDSKLKLKDLLDKNIKEKYIVNFEK